MTRRLELPYTEVAPGAGLRPYLWLEVQGPNGRHGPIQGLIDTGADVSVLPLGYAQLMGYTADDLHPEDINQVSGTVEAFTSGTSSTAWIPELESLKFQLKPIFLREADALWGRADVLSTFGLVLEEAHQRFSLVLPDEES